MFYEHRRSDSVCHHYINTIKVRASSIGHSADFCIRIVESNCLHSPGRDIHADKKKEKVTSHSPPTRIERIMNGMIRRL